MQVNTIIIFKRSQNAICGILNYLSIPTKSGYNPQQLKGTNTGVFYGICSSEEPSDKFSSENVNEFTLLSQAKALTANRISYWLDINGMTNFFFLNYDLYLHCTRRYFRT